MVQWSSIHYDLFIWLFVDFIKLRTSDFGLRTPINSTLISYKIL
jgi:hypothetical protein